MDSAIEYSLTVDETGAQWQSLPRAASWWVVVFTTVFCSVQHRAWPVEALHPGSPPRLDMDRTAVLFSSGLPHLLPAERAHSLRCRDQALGPDTPQPLRCRWNGSRMRTSSTPPRTPTSCSPLTTTSSSARPACQIRPTTPAWPRTWWPSAAAPRPLSLYTVRPERAVVGAHAGCGREPGAVQPT